MQNEPQKTTSSLQPEKFALSDIADSITKGFEFYLSIPGPSTLYTLPFAIIALVIFYTIGLFGISPMLIPFAGGFMLISPAILTGFFRLADSKGGQSRPNPIDAFKAFKHAPPGLWVIALLCTFLFFVWVTDAAVLYSMMIGSTELPYQLPWIINMESDKVIPFELFSALTGAVIAFTIFAISAFSVPLLHNHRANLIASVHASVRAVFHNFFNALVWGITLTGTVVVSILLLPLFLVTLPVLAYASYNLYLKVFPRETLNKS
ncbi:MAG: DUF2189 domain-containing protein [Candidatus Polarisedimenticolaceae bacterium]|nr:DUF2189 domain-containing protein [Candidatus Polarisedimenticolaceae bacterium]